MNEVIELLKYTVPSIITGIIAAFFFSRFLAHEGDKRKFEAFKEKKRHSLPLRIQAYERMTLFLERIDMNSILYKIEPFDSNKIEYAKSLIIQINTEFEHNLVQQIYVSNDCWKIIKKAKQSILNAITAQSMQDNITSGQELQKSLLESWNTLETPTSIAQEFIQKEVHQLF